MANSHDARSAGGRWCGGVAPRGRDRAASTYPQRAGSNLRGLEHCRALRRLAVATPRAERMWGLQAEALEDDANEGRRNPRPALVPHFHPSADSDAEAGVLRRVVRLGEAGVSITVPKTVPGPVVAERLRSSPKLFLCNGQDRVEMGLKTGPFRSNPTTGSSFNSFRNNGLRKRLRRVPAEVAAKRHPV